MLVTKGSTNVSVELYIVDSTTGQPELGVVFNTAGIDLNYRRDLAAVVSITEVTLALLTTAHADGGFLEIGNGRYRLDVPDLAFATGVDKVTIGGTVTGMVVLPVEVTLQDAPATAANLATAQTSINAIPTTAMRGTDSAALASVATEARLAELDAANLPADIAAIPTTAMRGTDSAYTGTPPTAAAVADAVWDEVITTSAHNLANSAGKRLRQSTGLLQTESAVDDPGAAATTTTFNSGLTEADNFWNDSLVVFTSGTLSGQAKPILTYTQASGAIVLDEALTSAPADNDEFTIYSTHIHSVSQIADGVWDELQSAHVTVGSFGIIASEIAAIPTTAMRGTDSAALASVATEARLAELDAANIPADVDAVKVVTDKFVFTTANQVDSNMLSINSTATSAARLALSADVIIPATVDTVTNTHTPTTTEFQADDITEATADHYNGRIVIFTSGVLDGQATDITDYVAVGGIGQFTVTALTEAPSNNDTFIIV